MDRVEQGDRLLGLVRLELADQVERDAGTPRARSAGHFASRLLNPILAEDALARLDQRPDRLRAAGSWRRRSGSRSPASRPASRAALAIRARDLGQPLRGDAPSMAAAIESAMQRRQPLPRLWLMTDERQGEGLWAALERLPRGAGIVFRHYGLPAAERRRLFERVRRDRGAAALLLLAGRPGRRLPGADGGHGAAPAGAASRTRIGPRSGAS